MDNKIDVGFEPEETIIRELEDEKELLPIGAPFFPEKTPIPDYQIAWGINSDEDGNPNHGEPEAEGAEKELLIPVESPGPNEALLYMLTSEVNFNDVWAITGIPVSTFGTHDRDWHITGSGGLALVVDVGPGAENQVEVGDLVNVYSGQFDPLSPNAGRDPMYSNFRIQGYQSPDGSHQQFMVAQATQLFKPPSTLSLGEAGSYILTMGTIYRALFNTLDVKPNENLFVEGASTGTGRDTVVLGESRGLNITGLVSSDERGQRALNAGSEAYINRKQEDLRSAMDMVPQDPDDRDVWKKAGEPLLAEYREKNDGELADYVVSHAGEVAFSRSYQLLDDGGRLTFFGASTGYELAFLGKDGESTPTELYQRANLRPNQSVLVWYGTPTDLETTGDKLGDQAIEKAIDSRARVVVLAETEDQADHVRDSYDIEGAVSLESIAENDEDFEFVESLPDLPPPKSPDLLPTIGEYSNKMFKPIGKATGGFLQTPNNPHGSPDVIFERAGQNTLGVSTMLCAPYKGKVLYSEDMSNRRYSMYAPQVWMRQRQIYMPTTEIFGTHMKNTYEVLLMNEEIEQNVYNVPRTHLADWEDTPQVHQNMWDNNLKEGAYVINHALPAGEITSKEELFDEWD